MSNVKITFYEVDKQNKILDFIYVLARVQEIVACFKSSSEV